MKFAVESWAPEYGIAVDASHLDEPSDSVDVTIECPVDDWQPLSPPPDTTAPQRMLFVDGVRRIDARVWFDYAGITRTGVCASVAAGAVLCTAKSAVVHECSVVRGFFAAASPTATEIVTEHGRYEYFPCNGDTAEDLYLGIHEQMTLVEAKTAANHDVDLVVFDGPLRGRNDPLGVGYVKTQQVQYLPEPLQPILARLGDGQRTPLFLIGGRSFRRYSWYLRLPGPRSHPLSGVVRCEVAAVGTIAAAVDRAGVISETLPRYASEAHKDPRAPQNLYPIAGLEHHLRHRLGDQQLLDRALRLAAYRAAGS
jgi:hypothetical protein